MKRKSTIIFFTVLTVLLILCLCSCRELRSGNYRYTVENGEVIITEYTGNDVDVSIPEAIGGMPVVAIETSAFHGCDQIRSLTVPDSVVKIHGLAFSKCYSLEQVTLGKGIREIDFSPFSFCNKINYNKYENGLYLGNEENPYMALVLAVSEDITEIEIHPDTYIVCGSALKECRLLAEVNIPEGVISVGSFAFAYCSSLERVYIPKSTESLGTSVFESCDAVVDIAVSEENPFFKSVDGSLFSQDGSRLIKYTAGKSSVSYHVPEGTVVIEENAFENAKKLAEVALPDSVEEISHSAFSRCENMSAIRLGKGLKTIGGNAFFGCLSLREVVVPDSVEVIYYHAFSGCSGLENVVIGSGVTSIETGAFSGCKALNEVTFRSPNGWKTKTAYALFYEKQELSDPERNAEYLTEKYCEHYWSKRNWAD